MPSGARKILTIRDDSAATARSNQLIAIKAIASLLVGHYPTIPSAGKNYIERMLLRYNQHLRELQRRVSQ